jgi:hypothetical protein
MCLPCKVILRLGRVEQQPVTKVPTVLYGMYVPTQPTGQVGLCFGNETQGI